MCRPLLHASYRGVTSLAASQKNLHWSATTISGVGCSKSSGCDMRFSQRAGPSWITREPRNPVIYSEHSRFKFGVNRDDCQSWNLYAVCAAAEQMHVQLLWLHEYLHVLSALDHYLTHRVVFRCKYFWYCCDLLCCERFSFYFINLDCSLREDSNITINQTCRSSSKKKITKSQKRSKSAKQPLTHSPVHPSSWSKLLAELRQAPTLAHIAVAHNRYLERIEVTYSSHARSSLVCFVDFYFISFPVSCAIS